MNIPIQNIYYLLCYAWNKLEERDSVNVQSLDTTELGDLFAKILITTTSRILKQGLDRYYVEHDHIVSGVKGKLDFSSTMKQNLLPVKKTACSYDEFDYNILHNQIIKTTISKLLRVKSLDRDIKNELHKHYTKLPPISEIHIRPSHFRQIRLHRNNYHYEFILKVCQIINDNLLIGEKAGELVFADFLRDESAMARLFESFVKNFYTHEQNEFRVSSEIIKWDFSSENIDDQDMLPNMRTDITLNSPKRKIIIDTKYYKQAFQEYHEKLSINSSNLYQIYAYLRNQEDGTPVTQTCRGILLYPAINSNFKYDYTFDEHAVSIMSIDLKQDWQGIRDDLLGIVE